MAEFPDQASPPIAWSSPANSPLPSAVTQPRSDDQQFETREFRLSDHPPVDIENIRPSSQPVVEPNSRPTLYHRTRRLMIQQLPAMPLLPESVGMWKVALRSPQSAWRGEIWL